MCPVGVLSKPSSSYLHNILHLSKVMVIQFIRLLQHVERCTEYVCVCCYMCLCVWILMQNNWKLIWDWRQSNLLFSFVGFPAQPLFFIFIFWLTALPLDFVLKECGHSHRFVTRQSFSQHVCSMNISSHTVLICFDVSDSILR